MSYFGLQGEENRQKLADLCLRPTTWKQYCEEVSPSNCTIPDETAQRAPEVEDEEDRMFVDGLYTGHFRKTEENDCETYPHNCTGHIADYPCGWSVSLKDFGRAAIAFYFCSLTASFSSYSLLLTTERR